MLKNIYNYGTLLALYKLSGDTLSRNIKLLLLNRQSRHKSEKQEGGQP